MSVIICTSTGTMLTAETCRLVSDDAFTDAEWDLMESCSDSEIADFGRERGVPILPGELPPPPAPSHGTDAPILFPLQ